MTTTLHDELIRTTTAQIRRASVSAGDNNAYLLTCSATRRQLLIDAADDAPRLLAMIEANGDGGLETVVTTHRHADHTRALATVAAATGAVVAAGENDADALPVPVGLRLRHGDRVDVGDLGLEVIHLRGHTPGSVTLVLRGDPASEGPDRLFTGDSLFPGGVGRTWSPEDFASLIDDVESRIFARFQDDTVVHPGHGLPTTVGRERPQLSEWRRRGW